MKTFRIMCAALLAAMTLASCQKEQAGKDNGPQQPKTITISLSNVQTPVKSFNAPVQNGSTATVNNYQVFLADATGNFYTGKTKEGADAEHYIDITNGGALSTTFHFVDPMVEQVYVVANLGSEQPFDNVEDLKAKSVNIESQQDVTDLVLFGYDELTASSHAGNEVHEGATVFEAAVEIAPLVARIEISKFSTTFPDNSELESITINKIAFNDYYRTSDLEGNVETRVNTDIKDENAYEYLDALNATPTPWYYDALTAQMTAGAADAVFADDNVYSYNFYPVAGISGTEEGYPQIVIGATVVDTEGRIGQKYLATNSFSGVSSPGFVPGNVYTMSFAFAAENLKNQLKCVEVKVSVKPWTVITVTPNL